MASLDDDTIQTACEIVRQAVVEARNAGKIRLSLGLHGHNTLMLDHLERWFEAQDKKTKENEILGLAVDALVAFCMVASDYRVAVDKTAIKRQLEEQENARREYTRSLYEDSEGGGRPRVARPAVDPTDRIFGEEG